MEQRIKKEISCQDEGEEQLFILIKEAGEEARKRRKKMLNDHFEKLKQTIKDAVSSIKISEPK